MPEDRDETVLDREGKVAEGAQGASGEQLDPSAERAKEYEEKARAKGWRPKEEYQGDDEDWVGAEEFVKREPLFKRIKSQSKELKEVKAAVEAMSTHFKSQVEAQVKARIAQLKAQRVTAIELGEVATVEKIDQAIENEKASVKGKDDINANTPPEVVEFVKHNPWFESNEEMRDFAIAHNSTMLKKYTLEEALKRTRTATEKAFPEFFGKKPKVVADDDEKPTHVEGGGSGEGKPPKKGYTMDRLNESQKLVYNQLVKTFKTVTHEEYFKSLEEVGELQ